MTTPPPGDSQHQIVTPTPEESKAIQAARELEELRALAKELFQSGQLGFDPSTLIKGTVKAFDFSGSPPTLTITIGGDTTTEVSDVRLMNNYSPEVGHTVLIAKQGAQIVVLGHIAELSAYTVNNEAGGWQRAELSFGAHGGGDNGDLYYRRILDHGSWKVQWRGGWTTNGQLTVIASNGLEGEAYRPSSKRTCLAARSSNGAAACHITFDDGGNVYLEAPDARGNFATVSGDVGTGGSGGFTGAGGTSGFVGTGGADPHTHSGDNHVHSGASHDHSFSGGAHIHSVNYPTWVSFNGVEYFL